MRSVPKGLHSSASFLSHLVIVLTRSPPRRSRLTRTNGVRTDLPRGRLSLGSVGRRDGLLRREVYGLGRFLLPLSRGVVPGPWHRPIENVIVGEPFPDEEVPEEFSEVRVVRFVVEPEGSTVVEKDGEFVGEPSDEVFGWGRHLLLHDPVVLLLLGGGLETLPGEGTTEEVHEDVSERFDVISTGLFCEWARKGGG